MKEHPTEYAELQKKKNDTKLLATQQTGYKFTITDLLYYAKSWL